MTRVRNLTPEERAARDKIRGQASNYAKTFLMKKYRNEYHELYSAYLRNRGLTTDVTAELIDEREISA